MFIVAVHTISQPEKFWSLAKATPVPPPLKLHCVFPSSDGKKGTCVWEAESLAPVQAFVETLTRGIATNEYMAVDSDHAMGLPR